MDFFLLNMQENFANYKSKSRGKKTDKFDCIKKFPWKKYYKHSKKMTTRKNIFAI